MSEKTSEMTDTLKSTCEAMLKCATTNESNKVRNNSNIQSSYNTRNLDTDDSVIAEHVHDDYSYNIATQNRYKPLESLTDDITSTNKENNRSSNNVQGTKLVAIIGNSHIRNLRTNYLLRSNRCVIRKTNAYSFEEAKEELKDCEQRFDCIFIHTFTNDLRKNEPETCVDLCSDLVNEIKRSHPNTKIVISLPFPTTRDRQLNEKIQKYNILIQYTYLNCENITLCENQGFCVRGNPIKKFFSPDGIHLSNEGLNIFATNIKSSILKCLNLVKPELSNPRTKQNNQPFLSDNRRPFQNNRRYRDNPDKIPTPPFGFHPSFMFPYFQNFNPQYMGRAPTSAGGTGY